MLTPCPTLGPLGRSDGEPPPSSLLTSLISCWELDEASGDRADAHAENDLTDNNTVTSAAGKIGNAAEFTAANLETLSHVDNPDLRAGDVDYTISAWMKIRAPLSATRIVLGKSINAGGSANIEYRFNLSRLSDTNGVIAFQAGTPLRSASYTTQVVVETWYFLIGWHDPATDTINIQVNDGTIFSASKTGGLISAAGGFRLGAQGDLAGSYFDGWIDQVAIWKKLLTAEEKSWLYNSGNGRAYPWAGGP